MGFVIMIVRVYYIVICVYCVIVHALSSWVLFVNDSVEQLYQAIIENNWLYMPTYNSLSFKQKYLLYLQEYPYLFPHKAANMDSTRWSISSNQSNRRSTLIDRQARGSHDNKSPHPQPQRMLLPRSLSNLSTARK